MCTPLHSGTFSLAESLVLDNTFQNETRFSAGILRSNQIWLVV